MEYHEFLMYTGKCIADFMGMNYQVSINHVTKNNGVILDGLVIMKKGQNISPTIYMEPFFEAYCEGREVSDIVKEIVGIYEEHVPHTNMNMQFFKEYEMVKNKIVYRLVSYEKNMELLKTIPHRRFLDLAVIYYCTMLSDETGNASVMVQNEHLDMWAVTEEDLFREAEENTRRFFHAEIYDIENMMNTVMHKDVRSLMQRLGVEGGYGLEKEEAFMKEFADYMYEMTDGAGKEHMYILTNHVNLNGAACMIYPDVLRDFANEKGTDLYILPSSIHEAVLVLKEEGANPHELSKTLIDVNRKEMNVQEVLSDSVYYYDRHTDKLHII